MVRVVSPPRLLLHHPLRSPLLGLEYKCTTINQQNWRLPMALSLSSLLPIGTAFATSVSSNYRDIVADKVRGPTLQESNPGNAVPRTLECGDRWTLVNRRGVVKLVLGASSLFISSSYPAIGDGLPPEQKPKLCDDSCERELENVSMVTTDSGLQYKDIEVGRGPSPPIGFQVAANYVAMVPSGQIVDSSLEKGQVYLFRVGSGQVVKGLDEGILSMRVGGKRRLYIPGSLAFPKGLASAPGRPRVAPNSPVIFDVSLEYIPGLEQEED